MQRESVCQFIVYKTFLSKFITSFIYFDTKDYKVSAILANNSHIHFRHNWELVSEDNSHNIIIRRALVFNREEYLDSLDESFLKVEKAMLLAVPDEYFTLQRAFLERLKH